jgi:hypothetical protein
MDSTATRIFEGFNRDSRAISDPLLPVASGRRCVMWQRRTNGALPTKRKPIANVGARNINVLASIGRFGRLPRWHA